MAENSAISWTDHTFNPWIGCQKVGPGCDHYYAEAWDARGLQGGPSRWGADAKRTRTSPANWAKPRAWNRAAERSGIPPWVFCASLADVFDNAVPGEWRADLWRLVLETPALRWIFVTKRIGNAAKMLPTDWTSGAFGHCGLVSTVVNQTEADRDVPKLLATPAAWRGLSMEPLLGRVELSDWWLRQPTECEMCDGDGLGGRSLHWCPVGACPHDGERPRLDWVIAGGESGLGARPMHPDWSRLLRDQCAAAGVPFHFKQWGEWLPGQNDVYDGFGDGRRVAHWQDGGWGLRESAKPVARNYVMWDEQGRAYPVGSLPAYPDRVEAWASRVGKKAAGRLLDGVEHNGMPPLAAHPAPDGARADGGPGRG